MDQISIEELKSADMIDEMMEEFKDIAPGVYDALVNERDQYLAGSIMNIPEESPCRSRRGTQRGNSPLPESP